MIFSAHGLLSSVAGMAGNDDLAQTLAIDEDEAKALAQALGDVLKWHKLPKLANKWADRTKFLMVLANVYGTRLAAWRLAHPRKPSTKPSTSPATAPSSQVSSPASPSPSPSPSPPPSQALSPRPLFVTEAERQEYEREKMQSAGLFTLTDEGILN